MVKNLIKLVTAGSVDDGKSTLIGRLLYDTRSLSRDRLEAMERSSRRRGHDHLDFSLATDGLVAEREQGITIDVAHIYLSTERTNFVLADSPGHVEYTRNMVTGASTSQAAIILVDARNGVSEQTRRHFHISSLLKLSHVVVAVNKMDLLAYDQESFLSIRQDFQFLIGNSHFKEDQVTFIPVSALKGDNVAHYSEAMPWYQGPPLLECLENLAAGVAQGEAAARFSVQHVIRPKTAAFHDFRGISGKLQGGSLRVGDDVTVLPSLRRSRIKGIHFFDKSFDAAAPGSSLTLTLEDELDVGRGDMLVKSGELPLNGKTVEATVCQLSRGSLRPGTRYMFQHGTRRILARVADIKSRIAADFIGQESCEELNLNDIGRVVLQLNQPVFFDPFETNKATGCFILIDPATFDTVSTGFIHGAV